MFLPSRFLLLPSSTFCLHFSLCICTSLGCVSDYEGLTNKKHNLSKALQGIQLPLFARWWYDVQSCPCWGQPASLKGEQQAQWPVCGVPQSSGLERKQKRQKWDFVSETWRAILPLHHASGQWVLFSSFFPREGKIEGWEEYSYYFCLKINFYVFCINSEI